MFPQLVNLFSSSPPLPQTPHGIKKLEFREELRGFNGVYFDKGPSVVNGDNSFTKQRHSLLDKDLHLSKFRKLHGRHLSATGHKQQAWHWLYSSFQLTSSQEIHTAL